MIKQEKYILFDDKLFKVKAVNGSIVTCFRNRPIVTAQGVAIRTFIISADKVEFMPVKQ